MYPGWWETSTELLVCILPTSIPAFTFTLLFCLQSIHLPKTQSSWSVFSIQFVDSLFSGAWQWFGCGFDAQNLMFCRKHNMLRIIFLRPHFVLTQQIQDWLDCTAQWAGSVLDCRIAVTGHNHGGDDSTKTWIFSSCEDLLKRKKKVFYSNR